MTRIFQRHIALPTDHGSWVFLLSPLLIGLFAAGIWNSTTLILVIAALAAFLLRQPISIIVKVFSGRRSQRDLLPAMFWAVIYGLVGTLSLLGLSLRCFSFLLWLAIPGVLVFAFHLYLVSRRAERKQMGVELIGTGVLALAAPAAYWTGIGEAALAGWWLFILSWLQSAASIVYAYARLEQRELVELPSISNRFLIGYRALLYTGFNFILVLFCSITGVLPSFLFFPFGIQLAESIWGTIHPALGLKPTQIGLRQLFVSSLFTLFFVITWR